jgi:hypothetical protein
MLRNRMTRYEMPSEDAMLVERGWRRLLQEIGVAFHHPEALQHFRCAGKPVLPAREVILATTPDTANPSTRHKRWIEAKTSSEDAAGHPAGA